MKDTNLDIIKSKSKLLFDLISFEDAMRVINDELAGIIISHPYTNSAFVYSPKSKKMVNLMEDEKAAKEYREEMFKLIDKANSVNRIFMLLNKPYYLYWFKITREFMSDQDYAEMLKTVWTCSENPNMDVNVPLEMSLGFFEECNMNYLMDDNEKQFFNNLPDKLTLYRGVSNGRTPFGLSYTIDLNKAEWFSKRFSRTKNDNYIISLDVKKEDCLCYINSRDEKEIVLNINKYLNEIKNQIPTNKEKK
jgi:hypothetical protein